MNKVLLTGRLTRDPELRYTSNNKAVCNFTIATNRPVVRDGEKIADFINCIVWGKTAENLSKYQSKGSLVGIDGRLESRSYDDKDGNKRYVPEVASKRFNRDVKQAVYQANLEAINSIKLQIRVIESQLQREWGATK